MTGEGLACPPVTGDATGEGLDCPTVAGDATGEAVAAGVWAQPEMISPARAATSNLISGLKRGGLLFVTKLDLP